MIDMIRDTVRKQMTHLAKVLNTVFRGKLTPNMVSALSLLGHGLVLWALVNGLFHVAVPLLIVFGLMDALDGALARLQGTPGASGMLLDASFDRIKEAIIYFGLAEYFLHVPNENGVRLSIIVMAGSMLVSYIKAKGETALTDATANQKNQALKDGFARYEIRMTILIVGLLVPNYLVQTLAVLAVLVWLTAGDRFIRIYRRLS